MGLVPPSYDEYCFGFGTFGRVTLFWVADAKIETRREWPESRLAFGLLPKIAANIEQVNRMCHILASTSSPPRFVVSVHLSHHVYSTSRSSIPSIWIVSTLSHCMKRYKTQLKQTRRDVSALSHSIARTRQHLKHGSIPAQRSAWAERASARENFASPRAAIACSRTRPGPCSIATTC